MQFDIYNLAIEYIKVYYYFMGILHNKKDEAFKLYNAEMKEAVVQSSCSNKSKYQDKVCNYIPIEEYINYQFRAVKKAEKHIDEDLREIIVKSIVKDEYIPCRLTMREFVDTKMNFIEDVTKNILGKGMKILDDEAEGW